jgi:hypothetical protein
MKKIVVWPVIAAVFMMLCPAAGLAATEASPFSTPLIAGGGNPTSGTDVGDILVWNDGDNLYVKYEITNPEWCLRETHLDVQQLPSALPQTKRGNPIPGKFTYKDKLDCTFEILYVIPWSVAGQVAIAAHAVVQNCYDLDFELDVFAEMLPDVVNMSVVDPYVGASSYFAEIIDGDPLTGTYLGWCIDTDLSIQEGVIYTADVFSSYEMLPLGMLEKPENLDAINWIINQDFVGKDAEECAEIPGSLPTFTYGSVQRAIWGLIDNENSTLSLGPFSTCQVNKIMDAALTSGEGFIPGCNQFAGVILRPFDPEKQITLIQVETECEQKCNSETAWGDGIDFPGANWATYFNYVVE